LIAAQDMLRATAAAMPGRVAIIDQDGTRRTTYAELDAASDALAAELQRLGVQRGDRVGVMMPNAAELVIAIFGAIKAGAVFAVVNPAAKPARAAFVLRDCAVRALVASTEVAASVIELRKQAPDLDSVIWAGEGAAGEAGDTSLREIVARGGRPCDPGVIDQDLCTIIYTSGTTGEPKGVMLTHRNVLNTTWANTTYLGNTADDVICCVLPLAFSYGLCQVFGAARVGSTLVIERAFTYPFDVLKRMAEHRATGLPALPTVFARLIQMAPFQGLDLGSLRYMTNAAAPLPAAHIRKLRELFPRVAFFSMYGQTECTRVCYLDPSRIDEKPDSVGRAIPNCEAYVIDASGRRAGPGVVGELVVRGANVMRGYWGRPEATAEKLRDGEIAGEKVLHTGDLFRTDAEGLLYFVGRTDDVFKVRGEKVSPREIENVLCELPEVAEAAAVGVDDPIDGQAVKVVVVPRAGAELTEQRVRQHCKARLEGVMIPKYVEIRPALPKTDAGKLNRLALRAGA
jgi:amino acid adenylation domain-containing protein